ncbi:MAG: serine/threonine-protein kinase [Myxococcales bacterium]
MAKAGKPPDPTTVTAVALHPPTLGETPTAIGAPAPPPEALPPLPRGTAVGRYLIEGPLGEGGMGVVYLAHDPQLDRPVALKLLRPEALQGAGGSEGRNRLVREAHAMAKLNHPNVVAIYDSGVYGEQVFLAVEVVQGTNLGAWLREAPRGWREVLGIFLQAGRGLAAAHAAGLVHRDFKPENVLIGRGGEVKVADFGLARAAGTGPLESVLDPTAAPSAELIRDQILATPITRVGLLAGTPAYMSPEQLLGRGGDARADEFSFCVTLYRSLYGELPFEGPLDPSRPNSLRPPPTGSRVPAWVRRALLRGLSIEPEGRYGTLAELLDALADDPAVRRHRALSAAAMAALLAAAVGGTAWIALRLRAAADPCHDPGGKLAGVWDDSARRQVQAAFMATGAPEAAGMAAYALKAMDRASAAWLGAYRDACGATRLQRIQPEAALELRLDCLDEQRLDLRAAGEIMSHPEARDLSSAIGAAATLPLPLECADAHALSVVERPGPGQRHEVEVLRFRLAQGRALVGAGRYRAAVELLKPLPEEARAAGAPPLQIGALVALAGAHHWLNDYPQSIELDMRAEELAAVAHLDELATQAAAAVAFDEAVLGSPAADVDFWLTRAREDFRRIGRGGPAEYYLQRSIEIADHFRGHFEEAVAHARRALDLAERLFGSGRPETMYALANLAADLEPLGGYDEQLALFRRAIADADAVLGPKNQRALFPQLAVAELLFDLGRVDEAERALGDLSARLGTEERIQAAAGLAVRAALQAERGQRADSLRSAQRALDLAAGLGLLWSPNWSDIHRYVTEAYLRDGRPDLAVLEFERHLAHQQLTADSLGWVAFLRLGGWAYLDAGRPAKALPLLERALALSAAHPFYPDWAERLRSQIARALSQRRRAAPR